jgi:hypothetical protein
LATSAVKDSEDSLEACGQEAVHKPWLGVGLAVGGVGVAPREVVLQMKHGTKSELLLVIMVLSKASTGVPMVAI